MVRATPQNGGHENHGHNDDILVDQDSQGRLSVRAVDFRGLLNQFQDNGGTAERHQKTNENGLAEGKSELANNQKSQDGG